MRRFAHKGASLDLAVILFGCAVTALGLALFTIPNDIAPGGVSGLATVLARILPLPVGVWTVLVNVPLLIIAYRQFGLRPLLKTILGALALALCIDLFLAVVPPYTNDALLAAVLGGVLCGGGMGLVFLRGGSTGGTDLVSLLMHRAVPGASVGTLLMMADAAVVLVAVLVFRELEVALYSIVTLFVTSKTVDAILQGAEHAKALYVVTKAGDAVNKRLQTEVGCGVTVLDATGGYRMEKKSLLLVVVRRNRFALALSTVRSADPDAFLFVANAAEVHGEGFERQAANIAQLPPL